MNNNSPPLESQKEIYLDLEKEKKLLAGDYVYLISWQWLTKFKNDTGFNGKVKAKSTCGEIDNSCLMANGNSSLDGKRIKYDYEVLSADMWETLHDWYGGGPEVKVEVVNSKKGPQVLLSKFKLKCYYKTNNPKEIETHKYVIVKNLREDAMKVFGVPFDKKSRLWDYWKKDFKNEMKDDNELSKYNLYDNQEIYLDVCENGKWDKDDPANTSFDSVHFTVDSIKPNQITYTPNNNNYDNNNFDKNNNNVNYNYGNLNNNGNINNNNFGNDFSNNQVNYNQASIVNEYPNYPDPMNQISDFTNEKAPAPGVVGLQNIGNTCFFNAGVQCLLHNNPLINIFLHTSWENEINTNLKTGSRGELARSFGDLMKRVWSGDQKIITPTRLKQVIGQYAPQFSNSDQQDSHEFLTFLLTGLHEDLNRIDSNNIQIQSIVGNGDNDTEIAEKSWEEFKKKNDSVITDNFYGQFRSTLRCPECQSVTTVFDPYNIISLPMSYHNKGLKVTFIPLKFTDPYVKMNLKIPALSTFDVVSQNVTEIVGRKVKVFIGGYRILDDIEWGVSDYSETSQPHMCAFEIENDDLFYIPCFIEMNEKTEIVNYGYGQSGSSPAKTIGKPFLLSFQNQNPNETEISNRAAEYLSCFWDRQNEPNPSEYIKDIVSQGKYYAEPVNPDKSTQKIVAQVKYYDGTNTIRYDPNYPHLAKTFVKLFLNPNFMSSNEGENKFSYYSLFCHQKPKKEKPIDYNNPQIQIEECFSIFAQNETLDSNNRWHCPNCNKDVCADKKMDLWSAPDSLIINLKRFGVMNSKIETFVGYPIELDLADFIIGPQSEEGDNVYKLYGVTEHIGGVGFGHYTARVRVVQPNETDGKWYLFNDSGVSEIDENSAINRSAYVLFYQKMKPEEISGQY